VWYTVDEDFVDVVPFEDGDSELDHEFVYKLIDDIWKQYYETEMD
jgi:hypothetical protein